MLKLPLLCLFILLAACVAQVSHPTKSEAEMRTDIALCTNEANRKYWMDPIAALLHAYDCLEAKGYRREHFAGRVEQAMGEGRAKPKGPVQPCHVPCPGQH